MDTHSFNIRRKGLILGFNHIKGEKNQNYQSMNLGSSLTTIVIADDHKILREGLVELLTAQPDFNIVAEAENGIELIRIVRSFKPSIALVDITMPIMGGIEATKKIIELFPETGVIALTMSDESSSIIDIVQAGARGYLLKNSSKKELITAIQVVSDGGTYYCREAKEKLLTLSAKKTYHTYYNHQKSSITSREIEIMQLMCMQLTSKEIASKLGLAKRSIESARELIQKKIEAKNMIGIVIYAIENGYFSLDHYHKTIE
jgi:DNA-binding NarL/FixJ family response regulator